MDIQYVGEHLLPGRVGNFFVVLSFASALLATASFYFASKNEPQAGWKSIGRTAFRIHSLAVAGIISILFYVLFNHYFEYHYVWEHSNTEMHYKYILSCFWEGQEGSFMLWTFWNIVLGNLLIRLTKDWEPPVMTIVSSVQVFLSSMLLGIYLFDYRIGSNPFILLREHPDMLNMPFTKIADYAAQIDGRGLNPLLQNYWMLIHPPVLFLGFASTLVPFAYAIAGMWKKRYTDWQKPALPWAFFGVMVLGTGVLMGGAWAYEALSFGGFWAWDPVENASLVPWLTLVGAAHVMLINTKNKQSVKTTFFLTAITFILILYSTFLTRSGILGDSSVHAFTNLGMSWQLLVFLLFYLFLSLTLLLIKWKKIPSDSEENIWSREFWMFVGGLVLLISSFQIIFTTSIPVINKVFGSNLAPPVNAIEHYNSWQVLFAIVIALLIGAGHYFNYQKTAPAEFFRKIFPSIVISLVVTSLIGIGLQILHVPYLLLLFSSVFAVSANIYYRVMKGNIKKSGAAIAHVGFGLILLGVLLSTSKSKVISQNTSGINIENIDKSFSNNENIMLIKDDTLKMYDYYVSYRGKEKNGVNVSFRIDYLKKNESDNFITAFSLYPLVQLNNRMGNVSEPDTRHFLSKDIYTHITYADLKGDYLAPEKHTIHPGDTIFTSNSVVILENYKTALAKENYKLLENDIAVGANLKVLDKNKYEYRALPIYILRDNMIMPVGDSIPELGLRFFFTKIDPHTGEVDIYTSEKRTNKREFIIMKAIIFPYINLLWTGAIVMIIGILIALKKRLKRKDIEK